MIIINNQPINHSTAKHMIGSMSYSDSILTAMDQNQDVFNYPNVELLSFAVQLRSRIIDSAEKLSKSDAKFATFYGSRCNDDFWDLTRDGGFLLKSNVRPSQAVKDIYTNGQKYAFECATAMVIVLLGGVLAVMGENHFDRLYRKTYLWDWHHQEHLPLVNEAITDHDVPGDVRYFKNPQVNPRRGWWQGENTIVLPNNRHYGHGIGIQSAETVIGVLNKNRRPGATETAYLMHRVTRIDAPQLFLLMNREILGWTRKRQAPYTPYSRRSKMTRYVTR